MSDVDLLSIDKGTVTAPAGCGKTHLIALALGRHQGPKPILVLTHTNAGVAALRARLDRAGVAPAKYRLSTIDGWCMRLLKLFPKRGGHDPTILSITHPKSHYPALAVVPINLVPACRDCNNAKKTQVPSLPNDIFLHPYYDNVEGEKWLVDFKYLLKPQTDSLP